MICLYSSFRSLLTFCVYRKQIFLKIPLPACRRWYIALVIVFILAPSLVQQGEPSTVWPSFHAGLFARFVFQILASVPSVVNLHDFMCRVSRLGILPMFTCRIIR